MEHDGIRRRQIDKALRGNVQGLGDGRVRGSLHVDVHGLAVQREGSEVRSLRVGEDFDDVQRGERDGGALEMRKFENSPTDLFSREVTVA